MAKREEMKAALDVIKTLNHPVRLSILCHLIEHEELSAGEITEHEKDLASQSQVSQYLKWLREKKYVESRKEGQFVYYRISSPEIKELIQKMHELFCEDREICKKE